MSDEDLVLLEALATNCQEQEWSPEQISALDRSQSAMESFCREAHAGRILQTSAASGERSGGLGGVNGAVDHGGG